MTEGLAERGPVYRWLARLLVLEVDASLWSALRTEPQRALWARLDPALASQLARPLDAQREQALQEEFARLFLLPGGVSPLAHRWLEGDPVASRERMTALAQAALLRLDRQPIDAEPWGRLPLDHGALLLEIVPAAAEDRADLAVELDATLLAPWLPAFRALLAECAREPIYRAAGRLVTGLDAVAA